MKRDERSSVCWSCSSTVTYIFPYWNFPKCCNFVYSCEYAKLFSERSQFTTMQNMSEERRNKLGKRIEGEQARREKSRVK